MVAFTAALSAEVVFAAPLTTPIGDLFVDRIVASGLPIAESLDLSAAGTEAGETVNGMTRTVWREVPVADLTRLRVAAAGTNTRVGIWRQTETSLYAGDAPSLTNLERVGGSGSTSLTVDVDQSWLVYYVQAGVTAGTGADFSLVVEDATAPYGGTFATAIDAFGDAGQAFVDTTNAPQETSEPDPVGMSPTASAWVRWTSPDPSPEKIRFEVPSVSSIGQVGIGVYTGSSLGALSNVVSGIAPAADGVVVEFVPIAGTVYHVQIATTDDHNQYEVLWYVPAEAALPIPPEVPYSYLRAEVYDKDGVTHITEIPRRMRTQGLEPLNVPGAGSVTVSLFDPIMKAYPRLLRAGRIVKFFLGDKCISGFRIQNRSTTWVSEREYAGMIQTVSGPTVHFMLNDMVVHHDVWPPRPDSPAQRFYSWASRPGKGEDRWYVEADWDNPVNANSQDDPPGDWKKDRPKRARFGYPKKWPDPDSMWLWMKRDPDMNEGGYDPGKPLAGRRYYRHGLRVERPTAVRMFVTADENVQVYIDGEEVIRREAREKGYKTFTKYETTIAAGAHTVAIHVRARDGGVKPGVGDGVDAMMFTMYALDRDGKKDRVVLRSDRSWSAWYGRNVPGWNRAQVLKNSIQEARERDNDSANLLSFGFDGLTDSEGKSWTDRFNQEVQIGTSGLDLQQQLSESGKFDVWVDPEDFKMYAWRRRGKNKSASVALMPGVNLLDYGAEEQDEIGNDFLIQYDGGFTKVQAPASKKAYGSRETYVELGGTKDEDTAKDLIRNAIGAFRDFRKRSGSPEVVLNTRRPDRVGSLIGVEGAFPFLDFEPGDVISAPDEEGRMVPQRVMSIGFTEDENGNLTFDPDLEQVALPEPIGESLPPRATWFHWTLDETEGTVWADSGPYGVDMTIYGTPTLGQAPAPGLSGHSALFNGVDSYGSAGGGLSIFNDVMGGQPAVSWGFWVKTSQASAATFLSRDSANHSPAQDDRYWSFGMDASGFGTGIVFNQAGGYVSLTSSVAMNDGQWHRVWYALGDGTLTMYLDGEVVAEVACTEPVRNGYLHDIVIGGGGYYGGANYNWVNGGMDDVQIVEGKITAVEAAS